MTVKELKDTLNKFDDSLTVVVCEDGSFIHIYHAAQGVNEFDDLLILDSYGDDN